MILGIDIGGTNVKFGVVADDFTLLKTCSIPTRVQRPAEDIISDIIATAKALHTAYPFDRIGVGTPGDVDSKCGVCRIASNLPFKETPIAGMIAEATGLPTTLANDATAALYGELYAGIGKDYQHVVMITLGTGVGGGIALYGKPYVGALGYAGEIGHMVIEHNGLPCPCGLKGCYEQYASVTALLRQAREAIAQHPDSLLASLAGDSVSGQDVFHAKAQGCPVAAAVLDQYAEYIAVGINCLENILQPDIFVIGGAISSQGDNLLDLVRAKLHKPSKVFASALQNDAGIIGAAVTALTLETPC